TLALAMPAPSGADAAPPASCGGYRLITSVQGAGALAARTLAIYRARTLARLEGRGEIETACVDLTGDAQPELIIQTYSGGAHCCFEIFVYRLHPSFQRLLRYEANNAGGFKVHRLGGRIVLELGDDSFAYYEDLCYACSPARLPMAACYGGGRFADCTRQYPQLVRPYAAHYTVMLKEAVRQTEDWRLQPMRGFALGLYASYALLGNASEGVRVAAQIVPDEVIRWVTAQRPAVQKWLARRAGTLKR
ncbi:MAG: hypothetical protein ACRDFT_01655, partial [bacterium]